MRPRASLAEQRGGARCRRREQRADRRSVAALGGAHERGAAGAVGDGRVGAGVEQRGDGGERAAGDGVVQRPRARLVVGDRQ